MKAELEKLIEAYVDGSIAAEGMEELNVLLRDDAKARREFTELLNLDSALAAAAAGWDLEEVESSDRSLNSDKVVNFPAATRWLAIAACLALAFGGSWWWSMQQSVFATVHSGAGVEQLACPIFLPRHGQLRHCLCLGHPRQPCPQAPFVCAT